jgi:site-specific DNA recombinase
MTVPRTHERELERRVGLYMRVGAPGDDGHSKLEAQRHYLGSYCEAQGWTITREYWDRGSPMRARRSLLRRALTDAEQGCFDVLLVHRLDRLSRRHAEVGSIADRLESYGVALVSATQQIDTEAPQRRLMIRSVEAPAELDYQNASERRRRANGRRADA